MKPLLIVVVALLVLGLLMGCGGSSHADGITPKLFSDVTWELSAVQALGRTQGTGVAASYRVAEYGLAAGYVDLGMLYSDTLPDPFVGVSTNIPPVDLWAQRTLNVDTRWGFGYLFRNREPFTYIRVGLDF